MRISSRKTIVGQGEEGTVVAGVGGEEQETERKDGQTQIIDWSARAGCRQTKPVSQRRGVTASRTSPERVKAGGRGLGMTRGCVGVAGGCNVNLSTRRGVVLSLLICSVLNL